MHKPDEHTGRAFIDSEDRVSVTFSCVCGNFYCYYVGYVDRLRHIPAQCEQTTGAVKMTENELAKTISADAVAILRMLGWSEERIAAAATELLAKE